MDSQKLTEKVIEMGVDIKYIKQAVDSLAPKSAITWLKWGISAVGGVAMTALLIACGVF